MLLLGGSYPVITHQVLTRIGSATKLAGKSYCRYIHFPQTISPGHYRSLLLLGRWYPGGSKIQPDSKHMMEIMEDLGSGTPPCGRRRGVFDFWIYIMTDKTLALFLIFVECFLLNCIARKSNLRFSIV